MDIEREIAATVTEPQACATYQSLGVRSELFADKRYKKVFAFAMRYYRTFGRLSDAPSSELVESECPGYAEIVDGTTGAAPSYLAEKLKSLYIKRQTEAALRETLPELSKDPQGVAAYLKNTLGAIVSNCDSSEQCMTFGEDLESYELKITQQRTVEGAPYPFPEMQQWTGGIRPGEIAVLAAPTGKGKSMFACKTALEAVRSGWNVDYVTLELSIEDVAERMALMQTNLEFQKVPPSSLRAHSLIPKQMEDMSIARHQIADMPGKLVIERPMLENRTPEAIVQACKLHGCNFLIVDQLQFVTQPRANSTSEALGMVMRDFKAELSAPKDNIELPMLLVHQINREGIKAQEGAPGKIGSMTNLSSSSWIEQLADVVWGMGSSKEEESLGIMNLGTLKTRAYAPVGYKLDWDLTSYRFGIEHVNGQAQMLKDW